MKLKLFHLYYDNHDNNRYPYFAFVFAIDQSNPSFPMKIWTIGKNKKKWESIGGAWRKEEPNDGTVRVANFLELTLIQQRNLLVFWFEEGRYYYAKS